MTVQQGQQEQEEQEQQRQQAEQQRQGQQSARDADAAAARQGDLKQQYATHTDGQTAINAWMRGERPNEATLQTAATAADMEGSGGNGQGNMPGTTPPDTMTMTEWMQKRRNAKSLVLGEKAP